MPRTIPTPKRTATSRLHRELAPYQEDGFLHLDRQIIVGEHWSLLLASEFDALHGEDAEDSDPDPDTFLLLQFVPGMVGSKVERTFGSVRKLRQPRRRQNRSYTLTTFRQKFYLDRSVYGGYWTLTDTATGKSLTSEAAYEGICWHCNEEPAFENGVCRWEGCEQAAS